MEFLIYGVEETGGTNYLILELAEGDTLRERRERLGPLRAQALQASAQIAEALEVAHFQGLMHRDLKPAHVKITPEGRVKVLDFGLAKAIASEERSQGVGGHPKKPTDHGGRSHGNALVYESEAGARRSN